MWWISLSADSDYSSINYCSADSTRTRLFLHLALFSVKNYRRGRISSLATAFRNCKQRSKALEHVCRIWAGEKRWPASSTQSHNLSGELGNRFRIGIGVRKTNRNPKPNRNRNRNPNPGQPVISALSSQHLGALPLSLSLSRFSEALVVLSFSDALVFGLSGFSGSSVLQFSSSQALWVSRVLRFRPDLKSGYACLCPLCRAKGYIVFVQRCVIVKEGKVYMYPPIHIYFSHVCPPVEILGTILARELGPKMHTQRRLDSKFGHTPQIN